MAALTLDATDLLTTHEAAGLLDVSHTHLLQLLERGLIPATELEGRPRIAAADLAAYKARRREERRKHLRRVVQIGQELERGAEG